MSKSLTILGMVIAIFILVIFALDLVTSLPFHRASILLDIVFVLCAAGLGYLSWATFKEQE